MHKSQKVDRKEKDKLDIVMDKEKEEQTNAHSLRAPVLSFDWRKLKELYQQSKSASKDTPRDLPIVAKQDKIDLRDLPIVAKQDNIHDPDQINDYQKNGTILGNKPNNKSIGIENQASFSDK